MATKDFDFIAEMNMDSKTLKTRGEATTALLADDFRAAANLIGLIKQNLQAESSKPGYRSLSEQITHQFQTVMTGIGTDVEKGLIGMRLMTIEGSILRIEAVEATYAKDLEKANLPQKPTDILKSIQSKLQTYMDNLAKPETTTP